MDMRAKVQEGGSEKLHRFSQRRSVITKLISKQNVEEQTACVCVCLCVCVSVCV